MYKKTQETHILLKLDQSKDGILGPGFRAGKFRGFLNLWLRASSAQLRLDIVDQIWVQCWMGHTLFPH